LKRLISFRGQRKEIQEWITGSAFQKRTLLLLIILTEDSGLSTNHTKGRNSEGNESHDCEVNNPASYPRGPGAGDPDSVFVTLSSCPEEQLVSTIP
jgi:hypothetical protein